MKIKAFSLLEVLIVIIILAVVFAFFSPKMLQFINFGEKSQLKVDFALINSALAQNRAKNDLLQNSINLNQLDSARVNIKNEKLFSNILQKDIKSTTTIEKQSGSWAKVGNKDYIFFTKTQEYEFSLKDGFFECISQKEICENLD
ncbi:type II secretion system protein [Arcobacter porcinus]|uniref:type II secretion system protein n=1 Tax=Arcobacter porcinus TaxID=1935204 RepID=UPI0009F1E949|nr:type II secretion system protein [Arcobacter porcinus]